MTTLTNHTPELPAPRRLSDCTPRSKTARKIRESIIMSGLIACGLFSLATTLTIIIVLAKETYSFFGLDEVSLADYFLGLKWAPLLGAEHHFGIWPLISGTLQVTFVGMCVAIPLGLITAIWLSEYAPEKIRRVLKPMLEVLAGIPTVVFGFFALTIITPSLQWLHEGFEVFNAMSAGIAVGLMCLPIVTSLTEDALRAVPKSLREGAYGLGSTRFETSVKVVTPAALSGIIAAFLLAIARAIGEVMIVALAAGSSPPQLVDSLMNGVDPRGETQTMTAYMVQIFLGDVSNYGPEYLSAYAVGATLFVMTLALTIIGHFIRVKFRQAYE